MTAKEILANKAEKFRMGREGYTCEPGCTAKTYRNALYLALHYLSEKCTETMAEHIDDALHAAFQLGRLDRMPKL